MEVPKSEGYLRCVELSFLLVKSFLLRQMFEKFSSLYEVHYKVDAISLLKDVVHTDDKRVVNLKKNELFNCKTFN